MARWKISRYKPISQPKWTNGTWLQTTPPRPMLLLNALAAPENQWQNYRKALYEQGEKTPE